MKYNYKGWFFLCPVYCNYNPETNEMDAVAARSPLLEWWFDINEMLCGISILLMTTLYPDYEPAFPFKLTGKIDKPIE